MTKFPLAPGSSIGILGGGQLGRMLALAAAKLGFDTVILDPQIDCPAGRVARQQICAAYDDPIALGVLAEVCDVVSFEFENVPVETVRTLIAMGVEVAPGPVALAVAQDRVEEKSFLNRVGAPTVRFAPINHLDDLSAAIDDLGTPCLLKTRRDGYDGKGQHWIGEADNRHSAWHALSGRPAILEAAAPFSRELSIIAARDRHGLIAAYPLGENLHRGGILHQTRAPASARSDLVATAQDYAVRILEALDYVGVMGIELFELNTGQLLVNEIAPRVHNSGHWTEAGCAVDQFEQHIRAIIGWPLGPTEALSAVEMTNLLGNDALKWAELAADPDVRLHLYGKNPPKPGRKMGHINRRLS